MMTLKSLIFEKLKNGGLNKNDVVMLHSNIGPLFKFLKKQKYNFEVKDIAECIMEYFSSNGTLIIPTFNFEFCKGKSFSLKDTPSKMGVLSEEFRIISQKNRTWHPVYSFSIFGKIPKRQIENRNYIKFSNKSPQKAQSILVAGFPFGKAISDDLKITGGIINSLKGIGNDSTRFQLDATINTGNSGGPIVDKVNGSLVGVAVEKLNKDGVKAAFGSDSENTNYGIKASQVRDFLESNNIKVSVKKDKFKVSELEEATVFVISKRNK